MKQSFFALLLSLLLLLSLTACGGTSTPAPAPADPTEQQTETPTETQETTYVDTDEGEESEALPLVQFGNEKYNLTIYSREIRDDLSGKPMLILDGYLTNYTQLRLPAATILVTAVQNGKDLLPIYLSMEDLTEQDGMTVAPDGILDFCIGFELRNVEDVVEITLGDWEDPDSNCATLYIDLLELGYVPTVVEEDAPETQS